MTPIFAYWDIRGLAAPIRYLLEYAEVKYEDKFYKCGPPPQFDKSDWLKEKFSLNLEFPNLPYYIEGDVKLTQSGVIIRYLARKHGLAGKDEVDRTRIELLEAQLQDYRTAFGMMCYNPNFLNLKVEYLKALPDRLNLLTKFLGENKFVAGDYITYVDFILFEYLETQAHLVEGLLKDYPVLEQYHKRIGSLQAIENYLKSPRAVNLPLNGGPAHFGGPYSDLLSKN